MGNSSVEGAGLVVVGALGTRAAPTGGGGVVWVSVICWLLSKI